MTARHTLLAAAALAAAAAFPGAAAAQGSKSTYEPQQRLRASGLDTCTKSEVMNKAHCVKKCESGFRMEFSGAKPKCVATRPDAKYTPPKPSYEQPKRDPAKKGPAGA
jgi:hypothetical protein